MDLIDELLIGEAPALRRVKEMIRRIAPSGVPVMIEGESGTGKELVAQALHVASGRAGPFVAFNVCAIAESMFEDVLFGHLKGAFTGAHGIVRGYLAEADRGTLFLDEIAGLPTQHQMKLLRAVETREFRSLGASRDERSDFRLVSASNESIARLVCTNSLRLDLAHRLNGVLLQLPALRERKADIPRLTAYFVSAVQRADGRHASAAPSGMRTLMAHSWPGNVRELRRIVEAAAILSYNGVVDATLVEQLISGGRSKPARSTRASLRAKAQLVGALEAAGGQVAVAASLLGVSRATFYRHARTHRVTIGEFRPPVAMDNRLPVRAHDGDLAAPGA